VLKLKAGKYLPIEGAYSGAGRRLNIEFSYNRTFSASDRSYPKSGSWSRQMRPDYTLSLWPADFSREEAETQELITHVHFDAKYKVDSLEKLFGKEDAPEEELAVEKTEERKETYKRADLLKMHAYRDAIRRSAGAYVLYPGLVDRETRMHGFHELLPGLGAFPLRPDATDDGTAALTRFLKEIVAHVCNRASQSEQQSWQIYRIHKDTPPPAVRESLPEWEAGERVEPAPAVYALHGWVSSAEHLEWYRKTGLYNFRTEDRRGSLRLKASVSGARYLLLHGEGQYRGGGQLFQIVSEGPRVFSAESLVEKGYPGSAFQPFYLVFELKALSEADPLSGYDWDLSKIEGIGEARASALPERGIPLSEFMKGAKFMGGPSGRQ